MLFRTTKKCSQSKQKKKFKVSKVLAQLDTDVLIREIMGAIKGLVLEKKNNGINYRQPSWQIQWDKTFRGVGWDVFPLSVFMCGQQSQ